MKKKVYIVLVISIFALGTCVISANTIQKADADTLYFNPEIKPPLSPCDTGGNSICVDWDDETDH